MVAYYMLISQLFPETQELPPGLAQNDIQALVYDTRRLQAGALYIPLPGTRVDGHQYIEEALQAGAVASLCLSSRRAEFPALAERLIPVDDTRRALAEISARFWGSPAEQMTLIGVTGTNGKTTMTSYLQALLTHFGQRTGWIGTLGAGYDDTRLEGEFTTPFPPELQAWLAEMRRVGVQQVVMECSSHALEQQRLGALAFDFAIFSNLTQDHLDYHHSMQNYAQAKSLLFSQGLKAEGLAILNRDDPHWEQMAAASRAPMVSYSIQTDADLRAHNIQQGAEFSQFELLWKKQNFAARAPIAGHHNVSNLLAAMAVLLHQGVPMPDVIEALESLPAVPGRLQRVSPDGHPFAVYVDYAHTPDSLQHALLTLREFSSKRVGVVFGCGGDRDRGKRPQMGRVAQSLADFAVVTSDNPRSENPEAIIDDIFSGLTPSLSIYRESDRLKAIHKALEMASAGDCILVAGKGHENYQIIGDRRLHFDDREVVENFFHREVS